MKSAVSASWPAGGVKCAAIPDVLFEGGSGRPRRAAIDQIWMQIRPRDGVRNSSSKGSESRALPSTRSFVVDAVEQSPIAEEIDWSHSGDMQAARAQKIVQRKIGMKAHMASEWCQGFFDGAHRTLRG